VPVIASRVGGVPEIIQDGVTGFLVEAGNPAEIAARLVLLLRDEKLSAMMTDNAGKKISVHSADEQARRIIELVYKKLIQD
jgi:glycosyltransferase involved in cell wall biosynthesis